MPENTSNPPRWSIAPYFLVDDVVATANYYRDKLGFSYERFWGEPPCFCMVERSGVVIMLSQVERKGVARPNRLTDPEGEAWDAYVWIEDADALCGVDVSRGEDRSADLRSAVRLPRFRYRRLQRLPAMFRARSRRMRILTASSNTRSPPFARSR